MQDYFDDAIARKEASLKYDLPSLIGMLQRLQDDIHDGDTDRHRCQTIYSQLGQFAEAVKELEMLHRIEADMIAFDELPED